MKSKDDDSYGERRFKEGDVDVINIQHPTSPSHLYFKMFLLKLCKYLLPSSAKSSTQNWLITLITISPLWNVLLIADLRVEQNCKMCLEFNSTNLIS